MSTLKDELDKRIKRRDNLRLEYQKLLGRREQIEKELEEIEGKCRERRFSPEDMPHIIKSKVQEYNEYLKLLDFDLDGVEDKLKPFLK